MTTAAELRAVTEYKKLRKVQVKIIDVLENEAFGMNLEQLTNVCRISRKLAKCVLPTLKEVKFENGVYKFNEVAS